MTQTHQLFLRMHHCFSVSQGLAASIRLNHSSGKRFIFSIDLFSTVIIHLFSHCLKGREMEGESAGTETSSIIWFTFQTPEVAETRTLKATGVSHVGESQASEP